MIRLLVEFFSSAKSYIKKSWIAGRLGTVKCINGIYSYGGIVPREEEDNIGRLVKVPSVEEVNMEKAISKLNKISEDLVSISKKLDKIIDDNRVGTPESKKNGE